MREVLAGLLLAYALGVIIGLLLVLEWMHGD